MTYTLSQIFAYSIVPAALIAAFRGRHLSRIYFPFLLLVWLGLAHEIFSSIIVAQGYSNAVSSNIFTLVESSLLLWLFYNWKLFDRQRWLLYAIAILFLASFVLDNLIINDIRKFTSHFRVVYSFVVVLMSLTKVNRLVTTEAHQQERNAELLLVTGFIIFFTYQTLIEIFWVYGLNASRTFRLQVYRIMTFINLGVNIIYAIALLWMPKKRVSLLH